MYSDCRLSKGLTDDVGSKEKFADNFPTWESRFRDVRRYPIQAPIELRIQPRASIRDTRPCIPLHREHIPRLRNYVASFDPDKHCSSSNVRYVKCRSRKISKETGEKCPRAWLVSVCVCVPFNRSRRVSCVHREMLASSLTAKRRDN